MASQRTKQGRGPKRARARRFGSDEVGGLVFGGTALLLFLALISYTPEDLPSWVPFGREPGSGHAGGNFLGPVGAIAAGYGFFLFGPAVFLAPPMFTWWAILALARGRFVRTRTIFVFALFLLSGSALIELQTLLFRGWSDRYPLPDSSGGFFGRRLGRDLLEHTFGSVGALIIAGLVYLTSLLALVGIHPVQFALLTRRRLSHHFGKLDLERAWNRLVDLIPEETPPRKKAGRLPDAGAPRTTRARRIVDGTRSLPPGAEPSPPPRSPERTPRSTKGKKLRGYRLPSLELLNAPEPLPREKTDGTELVRIRDLIVDTLASFGVRVEGGDITRGSTITRYEIYPSPGLRISRITSLKADLARATRAERLHILAPVPGKDTVGIEIANSSPVPVYLRELLEDEAFRGTNAKLPLALGKDVYGNAVVGDLAGMPHLLTAGATGSGKSVCINAIIASLICRFPPDELKFIMIDPKVVEMQIYNRLPHLVVPVVTEPKKVLLALRWVINEMERRYALFAAEDVRNFEAYNVFRRKRKGRASPRDNISPDETATEPADSASPLPYIVVIIDELADLMQTAPSDVETGIARIAQKSRAAGIHLIVATQTPRADVVTGVIKANIPSRVAFQVSSKTDSRIILDENGAENLVGKGDLLYLPPGSAQLVRAQGALITDGEIRKLVDSCAAQAKPDFSGEGNPAIDFSREPAATPDDADEALLTRCVEVITTEKKASISLLQRRLRIGYTRAARMIDILEERGVIGPGEGAKPREILVDLSRE